MIVFNAQIVKDKGVVGVMKINGIDVQGIRRLHIEDEKRRVAKVWNRVHKADTIIHPDGYCLVHPDWKQEFVWVGYLDGEYSRMCVLPDNIIINAIKWSFENQNKYPRLRIKGDTIYVKIENTEGRLWNMGLL